MNDSPGPLGSFQTYIEHCVSLAGSSAALAKAVGVSGGRVGAWRANDERPNPLTTMTLADFSGHDLPAVLRLCGHKELAGIIDKHLVSLRRGLPDVDRQQLVDDAVRPVEELMGRLREYLDKV